MNGQQQQPRVKRTRQLHGEQLDAAREMQRITDEAKKKLAGLQSEYAARHNAILQETDDLVQAQWAQIAEAFGLNAESTWQTGVFSVNTDYIDHDCAFLIEREQPDAGPSVQQVAEARARAGQAPAKDGGEQG